MGVDGVIYRVRTKKGIQPSYGIHPHGVEDLVREYPNVQCEDDWGCVIVPEQEANHHQDCKNEQIMKKESAISADVRKEDKIERFIDYVGKNCPYDARDDPPAIAEETD